MSIDVEDYFQVSNFTSFIPMSQWESFALRVEKNTENLLEIFQRFQVKSTFFILGWVAERFPRLIQRMAQEGHEIASHGYQHELVYDIGPAKFREDLTKSKKILEDLSQKKILGYRAPSYSITKESLWALDILLEEGFRYDSSIFPVRHPRYGIPDARRDHHLFSRPQGQIEEFPPSTVKIGKYHLPIAGGGYFRLFPYAVTRWAVRKVNASGMPFIFYLHPWEIDPHQPRFREASFLKRFRHYNNLAKTEARLCRLLSDFSFVPLRELLFTSPASC